jgi:hypothetical protein
VTHSIHAAPYSITSSANASTPNRLGSPRIFERAGAGVELRGRRELAVELGDSSPIRADVQFGSRADERGILRCRRAFDALARQVLTQSGYLAPG